MASLSGCHKNLFKELPPPEQSSDFLPYLACVGLPVQLRLESVWLVIGFGYHGLYYVHFCLRR